ncbi:hypothetical protein CYG48_19280 (plasmid) [Neorhizobium sp. SOG26]|jgi:hypothetical protein|uniref:Uncharacterized protein n=1 Tax=Neorhizobium turbinariae TaxID=2937795 RepID=A0ABT0IN21_9HYPH|nr:MULTISPECIES: hypothetical protein [Neorhizobium]AXV17926.1 hypothetical protein CYG48_19280 [Neorhizobium sp. SOG26]MCK8779257.1 hypothetical protein [Neorhizobium turbinariae]
MPYYLVTQTSLVEANDEVAAARQVADTLQNARSINFTVKFDESSVHQIKVNRPKPAKPVTPDLPAEELKAPLVAAKEAETSGAVDPGQRSAPESPLYVVGGALFVSGLVVGLFAHMLVS